MSKFPLRATVIHRGEKWIVTGIPDVFQKHDLYNLAKSDARGIISKGSERRVNVPGRELTAEVDCLA